MVAEEIIIRPIITEKSAAAQAEGKYTFEVHKKATKIDIKNAVEKLFEVKVADVKIVNVKGKPKRQGYHVRRRQLHSLARVGFGWLRIGMVTL